MWRAPYGEGNIVFQGQIIWVQEEETQQLPLSEKFQGKEEACREGTWEAVTQEPPVPTAQEAPEQPFLKRGED